MPDFELGDPVVSAVPETYASADDLIARYDIDQLKRLVTDSRTDISVADLRIHANLTACLRSAAGMVEASLLHGARYSIDDLTSLTGNSQAYLVDLVCQIAFEHLLRRRSKDPQEREQIESRVQNSLKMLASGHDVFALTPQIEGGLIDHVSIDPAITHITRNLRTDQLRGNLFARD